jgi:hypothetical protein
MPYLILRQIENTSQKNELFRLIYRSFRIIIRFSGTSAGQDFGTCEPMPTSEDCFDPGREGMRRQENEATGEGMPYRMTRGRGPGIGVPGRVETKISVSENCLRKYTKRTQIFQQNLDKTIANI